MSLILNYLFLAISVFIVAAIVPGIRLHGFKSALVVAGVYGLLNFILFKVLFFITFPILILKVLTLGLAGILVNALLLMVTDKLLDGFEIKGFGSALLGAAGISVLSLIFGVLF